MTANAPREPLIHVVTAIVTYLPLACLLRRPVPAAAALAAGLELAQLAVPARTTDLGEAIAVDAVVVTAGATHVPTSLLGHLAPGSRMVIPLAKGGEPGERVQMLTVIEATPGGHREQTFDAVRFVPLLPGLA